MNKKKSILISLLVLVVGAVGIGFFWFNVADPSNDQDKTQVTLSQNISANDSLSIGDIDPLDLNGQWEVTENERSFVTYSVTEDFISGLVDQTANGTTEDVTGSFTIKDSAVTEANFIVEIAGFTSSSDRRDKAFQDEIMEVQTYPQAELELIEPISLDEDTRQLSDISSKAKLTLKGVTNEVDLKITQAQINNDKDIEINSQIEIKYSDFGIDNPSNPVVSVRDEGLILVQLVLTKAN